MTAALLDRATTRPPATRQPRSSRPKLRVLDQAATRRRARHRSALLTLFVAVLAGFFAVAFVHAELVAGQYELDAVRNEISQAEARHAELARAVEEASAPAVIVTRATELGMVPARQPVYLTAAVPVRQIEVGPSLLTPTATGATSDDDGTITQVAGPGPADGDRLQGSLGAAGGISAAVQIPATPSVALGTDSSPTATDAAASTPTATPATTDAASTDVSTADPGVTGVQATTPSNDLGGAPAQSGPISSIAGTRAVTSAAAGTASPSAPAAIAEPNTAGGLASVAATTTG